MELDLENDPYLKVVRQLIEAYASLMRRSHQHVQSHALTSAQFDVIVALSGKEGMSCKELSDRTLVTKGTLTGVLDRLVSKGHVDRVRSTRDRRISLVKLTPKGDALFQRVFPTHVGHLKSLIQKALSPSEVNRFLEIVQRFKRSLDDDS